MFWYSQQQIPGILHGPAYQILSNSNFKSSFKSGAVDGLLSGGSAAPDAPVLPWKLASSSMVSGSENHGRMRIGPLPPPCIAGAFLGKTVIVRRARRASSFLASSASWPWTSCARSSCPMSSSLDTPYAKPPARRPAKRAPIFTSPCKAASAKATSATKSATVSAIEARRPIMCTCFGRTPRGGLKPQKSAATRCAATTPRYLPASRLAATRLAMAPTPRDASRRTPALVRVKSPSPKST
mmetsp:Transcript_22707/g.51240  ORF Transcript_22707/g.51240 Transcript_22707/m.51240 type:complete len:240 (+) Transcript_22707:164-883(+)